MNNPHTPPPQGPTAQQGAQFVDPPTMGFTGTYTQPTGGRVLPFTGFHTPVFFPPLTSTPG